MNLCLEIGVYDVSSLDPPTDSIELLDVCRVGCFKSFFLSSSVRSVSEEDLIESTSSQVVCYDDICDSIEDELNISSISGTSHVTVDFLRRRLVLGFKLSLNVSSSLSILLGSSIFRETNGQEGLFDLLLE